MEGVKGIKVDVTHQLHAADEGQCTATTAAAHIAPKLRASPLHVGDLQNHRADPKQREQFNLSLLLMSCLSITHHTSQCLLATIISSRWS